MEPNIQIYIISLTTPLEQFASNAKVPLLMPWNKVDVLTIRLMVSPEGFKFNPQV